jgi:hypothetical protein
MKVTTGAVELIVAAPSTTHSPSVTVTRYSPAAKLEISSVVAVKPFGPLQLNDGLFEFVTVKSIEPSEPEQDEGIMLNAN